MIRKLWDALARALGHRGTAVFLAMAVAVGIVVGLAAAALIGAVQGLSRLTEQAGEVFGSASVAVAIAIPLGFVAAWWIAHRFAPEVAGDGVPEATAALAVRSGYLPTRSAPLKIVATALTLGPGGSAGREGPIVQVGSAVGSSIARHTGLGEDRVRSLVAAGAGAAIGASFNAPIAGMLFAMEVILGNFAVRHLNAVVVASVSAAVTTRSIVGEELILRAFPHRVKDGRELALYAILGVLAAAVAWVFLRLTDGVENRRIPGPPWVRPLLLGAAVAAFAWIEPDVLGTGQGYVRGTLNLVTSETIVWYVVLGAVGAKILATSLTMGSGGSGGAFMPSLFIGAALGASFADLTSSVWSFSTLEPGAFAVVGMAATFAAVARAPLTSILIVFEITQDYGLVLPLMLAASLATFLADRIHPQSIYSMALARRGIRLAARSEVDLLDTVLVGDVVEREAFVAHPGMTTAEVAELMDANRIHGVAVVDDGRLVGLVTLSDLTRSGGPSETAVAEEIMTPRPVTATPMTPVSSVLAQMASLGVGRIPVVENEGSNRFFSVFRREHAVRAYHAALGREVDHDLRRSRLQARVAPEADYHEIVIPANSVAVGKALREVPVPGGATIVSVRRGTQVVVPDGSTRLEAGDVLTAFARPGVDLQLLARISADDTGELDVVVADDAARFFDLEIPQGSVADGRSIVDLGVPGGCTIVSVRRGDSVIIPEGSTVLEAGDHVTVFARPGSRSAFAERLRGTAE